MEVRENDNKPDCRHTSLMPGFEYTILTKQQNTMLFTKILCKLISIIII